MFQKGNNKETPLDQELINIRVEVDPQIDLDLRKWAKKEGRSKRRQVAVLLRKLSAIRKSNPSELERLGLIDQVSVA